MKIGLDFDGVFCDVGKLLSEGAKKLFDVDLPPSKTTRETAIKEKFLSGSQFELLKNFVFENSDSNLNLEPVSDVVTVCRSLKDRGHKLQIVTKRNLGVDIARNFCRKIGLRIPITGLKSSQPKSSVVSGFDVFLDDSVSVLEELKSTIPNRFLFLWLYNQGREFSEITAVNSWVDFGRHIC